MIGGSILQLENKNCEDIYITAYPKINAFTYVYYQHYDFAKEIVEIPLLDKIDFGKNVKGTEIPKYGSFLNSLYLKISLPSLQKKSGTFASWCNTLGYAIFDGPIELEIGGIIVDRLFIEEMDINDKLFVYSQKEGLNNMILRSDIYLSVKYNALNPIDLIIPLDFWFVKQLNMNLPLTDMKQDIKINFKLKNFGDVINYDGDIPPDPVSISNASLFIEYIFLDKRLIETYKKKNYDILITQTLAQNPTFISNTFKNYNFSLDFNHMCKEIYLVAKDTTSINNNDYFNYSRPNDTNPIIMDISFLLDNKERFSSYPEIIYRTLTCKQTHKVIPTEYIYVLPFSDKPEINQPTGSLNLSCFTNLTMVLSFNNYTDTMLYCFAKIMNIVKIKDGYIWLEFSY